MVEFALILPAFVVLVFGAVEFGDAFHDMAMVASAARSGARLGSQCGNVESNVNSTVSSYMTAASLTGYTTTTAVTDQNGVVRTGGLVNAQEGDMVKVTVAYPFTVAAGTIVLGLTSTFTLHGCSTFRHD